MAKNPCHGITHVIKEGDTLYTISRSYRVPLGFLLRSNPYLDIYNLQIGDEICIPCMKYNTPVPGKPGSCRPGTENDCPYAGKPPFYKYPACKELTNPYGNDAVTAKERMSGMSMEGQNASGQNMRMENIQTPNASVNYDGDAYYNGRDMVYDGNDSDAKFYQRPESRKDTDQIIFDYVVGEGDTLGSILSRFDLTLYELLKLNDKEDLRLLPETILRIPRKAMDL